MGPEPRAAVPRPLRSVGCDGFVLALWFRAVVAGTADRGGVTRPWTPGCAGLLHSGRPDTPGSWVDPQRLRQTYAHIKALDPDKPVLACFTDPIHSLRNFSGTFDVALVDPYPIGDCAGSVRPCLPGSDRPVQITPAVDAAVAQGVPVILATQAMGGARRRERTPTAAESRLMATLGFIRGAIGVQWFIRVPPNGGPYAPAAWSGVRQLALMVAELAPALTSGWHSRVATSRFFAVSPTTVEFAAWLELDGSVVLVVANTALEPAMIELSCRQTASVNATAGADLLFQGSRRLRFTSNISGAATATDLLLGFGTAYYRLAPPMWDRSSSNSSANLVVNGGFEEAGTNYNINGAFCLHLY